MLVTMMVLQVMKIGEKIVPLIFDDLMLIRFLMANQLHFLLLSSKYN